MKHKARRAVISVSVFLLTLLVILTLNLSSGGKRSYAWKTIQYNPPTFAVVANGKCPGLGKSQKPALVVSRVEADGDAEWLDGLAEKYHLCVYSADDPTREDESDDKPRTLRVPSNRGHEAMAYLTFLIDNYLDVPPTGTVFVHGSRFAWHNDAPDYDNFILLESLNVSAALEDTGYHNLRCDWSAGTCGDSLSSEPRIVPQGSMETRMSAIVEPYNKRLLSDASLPGAFLTLFGGQSGDQSQYMLGSSEILRSQCCGQFVVSRERIWQHSRKEYSAMREWLLYEGAAPSDDQVAGRILSYLWHVLFLPYVNDSGDTGYMKLANLNLLACPSAKECYCKLYGRCDVKSCSPGHCGLYSPPKDYALPEDWAATRNSSR